MIDICETRGASSCDWPGKSTSSIQNTGFDTRCFSGLHTLCSVQQTLQTSTRLLRYLPCSCWFPQFRERKRAEFYLVTETFYSPDKARDEDGNTRPEETIFFYVHLLGSLCLLLINCGNFTVAILPWLLLPDLIILHLSVRTYSWSL